MALSILDGNQSATTLSTILTGGAHIPAHTVVSLGSQAITDFRGAVSGSVVSVPVLPAISGTVTANITKVNAFAFNDPTATTVSALVVAGSAIGGESWALPIGVDGNYSAPLDVPYVRVAGIDNGNVPISGTVTANSLPKYSGGQLQWLKVSWGSIYYFCERIGEFEWRGGQSETDQIFITYDNSIALWKADGGLLVNGPYFGDIDSRQPNTGIWQNQDQDSSITISYEQPSIQQVSGTVTVGSLPRPTWSDHSGSVVTANTAVTAISTTTRSYLLAQVTTGQMFLNIGATATTLNSVYFSAGQGFAWETSVPQGIVSIISAVTGTNYVLKDG